MCYSAIVHQQLHDLAREFGAEIEWQAFEDLFLGRIQDRKLRVARALGESLKRFNSDAARRIEGSIASVRERTVNELNQDLLNQRARLGDAERMLATKATKKAADEQRIASNKIVDAEARLRDLERAVPVADDSRIFPFWYAPVVVQKGERRIIVPMRYHCRPAGLPKSVDRSYPGLYNARRDSLEGFWRRQFGNTHALMMISSFFENVAQHTYQHRELAAGEKEQNLVLHFDPKPPKHMLVACLWSHWEAREEQPLNSYAAITDEPPPEIAAAGHNRCIVPIKPEHIDAWLAPSGQSREQLQAILGDREQFFYEHRIAA